tara:strand:+ start:386 stop:604 length:219 start_codon:yes stop_codon:yes gene_type:complete
MITLTEDTVNSMRFEIEWEIMDLTQDLINLLKENPMKRLETKTVKDLDTLIEQRHNLIGAAMVFDSIKESKN